MFEFYLIGDGLEVLRCNKVLFLFCSCMKAESYINVFCKSSAINCNIDSLVQIFVSFSNITLH